MSTRLGAVGLWVSLGFLSVGCAGPHERVLDSKTETLRARSIQTRVFDTAGRERTLRDVIATLADLDFWIEKADATLGVVKGSKAGVTLTVTARPDTGRRPRQRPARNVPRRGPRNLPALLRRLGKGHVPDSPPGGLARSRSR